MTKREIYNAGKERGYNIASWQDIPTIGDSIPRHIDWVGYKVVDADNLRDVWEMYCGEAESMNREYSPFEFTAHDLNEKQEKVDYDVWQEFERGIARGILLYSRKIDWKQYQKEGE
jgi:hypothetical protein